MSHPAATTVNWLPVTTTWPKMPSPYTDISKDNNAQPKKALKNPYTKADLMSKETFHGPHYHTEAASRPKLKNSKPSATPFILADSELGYYYEIWPDNRRKSNNLGSQTKGNYPVLPAKHQVTGATQQSHVWYLFKVILVLGIVIGLVYVCLRNKKKVCVLLSEYRNVLSILICLICTYSSGTHQCRSSLTELTQFFFFFF